MPASQWNAYTNAAFGNGRFGTVQLMAGGNMEIAAKDTVEVNENGMLIYANDEFDTMTLIPWGNIGYIRTRARYRKPSVNESKALPTAHETPYRELEDGDDAPRQLPQ